VVRGAGAAAVPAAVVAKVNEAMVKALALPEMKAAFAKIGAEPVSQRRKRARLSSSPNTRSGRRF